MNAIVRQSIVLDTFTGSGDITTSGSYLSMAGVARMYYPNGVSVGVLPSLVETANIVTITNAGTDSTTYEFNIIQYNTTQGRFVTYPIVFKSNASGTTTTTVTTALKAQINALILASTGLSVTVAGTTTLTITGGTGNPLFTVQPISSSITQAAGAALTIAPHATPGTALAGTTTVTVTTAAAHGLSVGQSVNITTATGFTFTRNGVATVATISNVRIATVPTSVTFTLYETTGAGTNTGTIVITVVPQNAVGTYALVNAVTNINTAPTSGQTYATFTFQGFSPGTGFLTENSRQAYIQTVYMRDTATTALATNFTNMKTALSNELNGLNVGGTAADAELYSSI